MTSLSSTIQRLPLTLGIISKILIKPQTILLLASSLKSSIIHCSNSIRLLIFLVHTALHLSIFALLSDSKTDHPI